MGYPSVNNDLETVLHIELPPNRNNERPLHPALKALELQNAQAIRIRKQEITSTLHAIAGPGAQVISNIVTDYLPR